MLTLSFSQIPSDVQPSLWPAEPSHLPMCWPAAELAGRMASVMIKAMTCWLFCQAEEPRLWELCRDLDSLGGEACVLFLDFHSSSVLDFCPFCTWAAEMPQGRVCVQGAEGAQRQGSPQAVFMSPCRQGHEQMASQSPALCSHQ